MFVRYLPVNEIIDFLTQTKSMKNTLLLFALLLFGISSFAQTTITGTITDQTSGSPLQGVSIKVKNSNVGTYSGSDGTFSISAPQDAILLISYVGYADQSLSTKGQSALAIKLVNSSNELTQIVVVGNLVHHAQALPQLCL